MARGRHRRHRRPDGLSHLSPAQEMELVVGPARGGMRSAFASDDERRAAWTAHRDRLAAEGHPTAWADAAYLEDTDAC